MDDGVRDKQAMAGVHMLPAAERGDRVSNAKRHGRGAQWLQAPGPPLSSSGARGPEWV